MKLTNGSRRRSRCGSDLVRCAEARRRVQFWTFTMSKSAAPTGTVIMRMRSHGPKHARTRACPRHTDGFWMFAGGPAGHLTPPACSAEGKALRRLFRFQSRALFGPIDHPGGAQISHARAHEPPIARSIGPCGGGAERGGYM
jgi:hypothetical protein